MRRRMPAPGVVGMLTTARSPAASAQDEGRVAPVWRQLNLDYSDMGHEGLQPGLFPATLPTPAAATSSPMRRSPTLLSMPCTTVVAVCLAGPWRNAEGPELG